MYSNPQLPEGINTSKEHPLREFALLLVGALVVVLTLSLVMGLTGSWLAGKIPFSAEVKIANQYLTTLQKYHKQEATDARTTQVQDYLQALANRIARIQGIAEPMLIRVHYLEDDTVNAFATLGGNVLLYRGLLERLDSENALAMLLAHEIAHVNHRHPIKSLGRGIAAGIAIAAISGSSGSSVLGETGLLTTLHFSREMETQCDETALESLNALYGHVGGGADLFREIQSIRQLEQRREPAAFFSTHPLDQARIEHVKQYASQRGWKTNGPRVLLPEFYPESITTH